MIVVIGSPSGRREGTRIVADGLAARIAIEAARGSRRVQLVGRIGDDQAADAVLQDLARAGVGHVATLRDPARATPVDDGQGGTVDGAAAPEVDGADVDLALRYLTEFRVIVLVDSRSTAVVDVVVRATEWGEATLVVAGSPDPAVAGLPARAEIVPRLDGEAAAAYAGRVAAVAVALDGTGA